ncbi:hypothetical protein H0G86_009379 [Trichoderma simmonsii]|uniref:Uncharacterized protein n=1 Tax=Trichoderma simmonsii TaxID=1491479 RepID=A0A8G0PH47_9HYPO|nr:hypothetical protein H0G86_009379 [Trichoderma simmonsii]
MEKTIVLPARASDSRPESPRGTRAVPVVQGLGACSARYLAAPPKVPTASWSSASRLQFAKTHQTRPLFASFQHPAIGRQSAQQLSRVFESTRLALKMSGAGADWPLSELEQQRLRPVVPCMQGALTDFARGARTWSG